jgi:hypothetical protein
MCWYSPTIGVVKIPRLVCRVMVREMEEILARELIWDHIRYLVPSPLVPTSIFNQSYAVVDYFLN